MQPRLSQIDESNLGDHFHLTPQDRCFYLYEYTSGRNFAFSTTNGLISNLKKKPSQSQNPGYHYKELAIQSCAASLSGALNKDWLANATLVPVPGSKSAGHADFDDRIERICRGIPAPDIRRLVIQTQSTVAAHEAGAGERITVGELRQLYTIDETLCVPFPKALGIVDDVLTAGTHYRAMHSVLSQRFPGIPIIGLFIARRIFPADPAAF